jgi:hypothetical protein
MTSAIYNPHRAAKPIVWVKDKNGETYLCPINAVKDPKNVTEAELAQCVNESHNPQNN